MWYDCAMSTEITPADERPLSTIKVRGMFATYHELSDAEMNRALAQCTRTEIHILNLAAKGMNGAEICREIGIKRITMAQYLSTKEHFHDAYYTVMGMGFSSENIRALAHSKAVGLVEHLETIATEPFDSDTKPARLAVAVNASKELLDLAGLHQGNAGDGATVNIGQLLVQLSTNDDTPQWKR